MGKNNKPILLKITRRNRRTRAELETYLQTQKRANAGTTSRRTTLPNKKKQRNRIINPGANSYAITKIYDKEPQTEKEKRKEELALEQLQ